MLRSFFNFMKNARFIKAVGKEYDKIKILSATEIIEKLNRAYKNEKIAISKPAAFAYCQKAVIDVLGKTPYETQILAGKVLSEGNIAEMRTGEGKTISEVFPAFWYKLKKMKVHIITANEYLAKRDYSEMKDVFSYLGLTTECVSGISEIHKKKEIYQNDIVYGTCKDFGFDYLRDNLVSDKFMKVQQPFGAAIVDEADSVLIDDAKIPLIISQQTACDFNIYIHADCFVKTLVGENVDSSKSKIDEITDSLNGKKSKTQNVDYFIDKQKNSIFLTDEGEQKASLFFQFEDGNSAQISKIVHYIYQALRANFLMKKDLDYIVENGRINLIDKNTGRGCPDRQFSEGLHQALEAKEHVEIHPETTIAASITIQKYVLMYRFFCGMTGTASTEKREFSEVYGKSVAVIPPHRPCKRIEHKDLIFSTRSEKYSYITSLIKERHKTGQPVLVGTASVSDSEFLARMLNDEGISSNILNARSNKDEASIIAQAGRLNSVTIATDIAGRGTDIFLGGNPEFLTKERMAKLGYKEDNIGKAANRKESSEISKRYDEIFTAYKRRTDKEKERVLSLGGLCVIGTERHESRRIDNQLIGRCARQGDPGISQFILSQEDSIFSRFDSANNFSKKFKRVGINNSLKISDVKILVKRAQRQHENMNFLSRKSVLEYDEIDSSIRKAIYDYRNRVLFSDTNRENMYQFLSHNFQNIIYKKVSFGKPTLGEIKRLSLFCKDTLAIDEIEKSIKDSVSRKDIYNKIFKIVFSRLKKNDESFKVKGQQESDYRKTLNSFYRFILISAIDLKMQEILRNTEKLKKIVSVYSYGTQKAEDIYLQKVMPYLLNFKDDIYLLSLKSVNKVLSSQQSSNESVNNNSEMSKVRHICH